MTYLLMWVLFPFLFAALGFFLLLEHGVREAFEVLPVGARDGVLWLWVQRKSLDSDPWKPAKQ
jgi:hypothetical protein